MSRCRPLLGRVPRVGSPTSQLLLRHSDSSCPGGALLVALRHRSSSCWRPRGLPGSCATLVCARRSQTPVEAGRSGPRARGPAFRPARCCLPRRSSRRPPLGCGSRGSMSPPAHPLSMLRSRPRGRTTQGSLPAGGPLPWPVWDFHPRVALSGFTRYMGSSRPRLCLAQERSRYRGRSEEVAYVSFNRVLEVTEGRFGGGRQLEGS